MSGSFCGNKLVDALWLTLRWILTRLLWHFYIHCPLRHLHFFPLRRVSQAVFGSVGKQVSATFPVFSGSRVFFFCATHRSLFVPWQVVSLLLRHQNRSTWTEAEERSAVRFSNFSIVVIFLKTHFKVPQCLNTLSFATLNVTRTMNRSWTYGRCCFEHF